MQSRLNIGVAATAALTAIFLAGAMTCLSTLVIPVLLDTSTDASQLAIQWARVYHYGHIQMPALCVGATSVFLYIALGTRFATRQFLAAGLTTIAMVPFTWIFMAPTNNKLFQMESDALALRKLPHLDEARGLVVRWAWLHATRCLFPMTGGIISLTNILRKQDH